MKCLAGHFHLELYLNRAEHAGATVIIKHKYMIMCNHKIVIHILLIMKQYVVNPRFQTRLAIG